MNHARREGGREYSAARCGCGRRSPWSWRSRSALVLSRVDISESSRYHWLVFQGTADDARTLLIGIAGTTITVIALVLGLTVVALQLSSTQYSPRIVRNFLRDRPNQIVLSIFVATFAYAVAGLYTVGVHEGDRSAGFPRAAVSGAIALLFLTLGALVYEVHHISHAMQVDQIMRQIQQHTTVVVEERLPGGDDDEMVSAPTDAVAVPAPWSGYLQTVNPESAVRYAAAHSVHIRYTRRVGQHIVAGSPLAWVWTDTGAPVDSEGCAGPVVECARIGFERTMEQDAAFGLRQLVDIAAKALSPAVNDPYTAVQAIDHLATILAVLAPRRLGHGGHTARAIRERDGPGPRLRRLSGAGVWADQAIRRVGAGDRDFADRDAHRHSECTRTDAAERRASITTQLDLVLADAEHNTPQPADLEPVRHDGNRLKALLT